MPYSHSAGPTKRKQRQQLTVPCDCNLCQGKPQTYRVVRRHKQAFGKNLGIDCNEHEEDEESSSLDESVEIKIDVSSKDSPSNSEDSQQSMKCLLVSSGTEDNSEVGFHVEPFNKISTTSRPSYESLPSADMIPVMILVQKLPQIVAWTRMTVRRCSIQKVRILQIVSHKTATMTLLSLLQARRKVR